MNKTVFHMSLPSNVRMSLTEEDDGYVLCLSAEGGWGLKLATGEEKLPEFRVDLRGLGRHVKVDVPESVLDNTYNRIVADHLSSQGWKVNPPAEELKEARIGDNESLISESLISGMGASERQPRKEKLL
jgi:hypothetical protein